MGDAGESVEGGAGGNGDAPVVLEECGADEYLEVGKPGCRKCRDWVYASTSPGESCQHIDGAWEYDRETKELVLRPKPGMPMPRSWTWADAPHLYYKGSYDWVEGCTAEMHTSIRDGLLVADLSEFQACADAEPTETFWLLPELRFDYGCAGSGNYHVLYQLDFSGKRPFKYPTCYSDYPPRRSNIVRPFVPTPIIVPGSNNCVEDEYREVGHPGCWPCGGWAYQGSFLPEADVSPRTLGTHSRFDRDAMEFVIEPGPDLPVPVEWVAGEARTIFHQTGCMDDAMRHIKYVVRDGLLVAEFSRLRNCEIPSGTRIMLDYIYISYGCAGSGAYPWDQWVAIDSPGYESESDLSGGDANLDWPPKRYRGPLPPGFPYFGDPNPAGAVSLGKASVVTW